MEANEPSRRLLTRFTSCALMVALVLATTAIAQMGQPAPSSNPPRVSTPPPQPQNRPPEALPVPKSAVVPMPTADLPAPALEPGEEGLPISLPAALKLANAQAWDIIIATQQLKIAAAQLQGANVLWLPNIQVGTDYQYHSGPIQNSDGTISNPANHSNLYNGAAPLALFALTDAIFLPLSQRQVVRAQDANIQTATNDTLTDMAQVYFNLMEAQADLASILYVDQEAAKLVTKAVGLTPGIIAELELNRVKAAKANFEQVVETARNRWRDASAEVTRVTRLKPTVVVQPLESAQLRITLVPLTLTPDQLISIGVANRPELTFEQAQAEAARERLRQEKWRPFLPTLILRGGGTVPPDAMAVGVYGGGQNGSLNTFNLRSDWDVGAYWEVRNLGFGNRALIRERRAEYDLARSQQYRFQDVVAREVMQAWADVRSADRRVESATRELQQADLSAQKNLAGLGQIKRVGGELNVLLIRPLEAVAALQALNVAYFDYFGVIADYNRAQFRLYRAVGSPAQFLAGHDGLCGPLLPPEPVLPPAMPPALGKAAGPGVPAVAPPLARPAAQPKGIGQ